MTIGHIKIKKMWNLLWNYLCPLLLLKTQNYPFHTYRTDSLNTHKLWTPHSNGLSHHPKVPNTMTGVHPPSRAANRSKRKHLSSNEEQSQSLSQSQSQCSNSRTKRRRVASSSSSSKPKTLTTIPDPPTTNQFQHLHSSSRSRRKHRDTKSNATEPSNRKWVFSSRDCSSYQGIL